MSEVIVRDEILGMPAYAEPPAEELPMFAENRVHQRSSGNPYPNKVVLRVNRGQKTVRNIRVITLENEYLRIQLMPELGGRIYSALDKRTGYDFFYKQHVIKPALIGLLGSWISGGVEFNWPCHHRPSTFMPVDVCVERHEDGAVTVWMSEHEPLDRMEGLVGVYLAPGMARFETRMKVYNRNAGRRSFLWWENAAVPVNEQYRLIFPPDVHYVQFHYRKNVTSFPVAGGVYNGIRMGEGTDISRHRNTRRPTSYFCAPTRYDFFGGYDEGKDCGVIHVAPRSVSPGKKMFTWAYNQLSQSWERALTDTDGAYAELMASSYSENQPDFAWLMPYESKEFAQSWYPVGGTGTPFVACLEAVVGLSGNCLVLAATQPLHGAVLTVNGTEHTLDAGPEAPFRVELSAPLESLRLTDAGGRVLLRYRREDPGLCPMPETLPDNPSLDVLTTAHQLYLAGVHVEQYRDPSVRPDEYWREALHRDPEFAPALLAMGRWELEHDRPEEAHRLALHAWRVLTFRNNHPESGEPAYLMGRILEALDRPEEAEEWYLRAAWNQDAASRAFTRCAMLCGRMGRHEEMLERARNALVGQSDNRTAQFLCVIALRRLGRQAEAERMLQRLLREDPLHLTARALQLGASPAFYEGLLSDPCQSALDVASDLWEAGETELAADLLKGIPEPTAMVQYVYSFLAGDAEAMRCAGTLKTGAAYPSRAIETCALRAVLREHPGDSRAMNLLACRMYATGNWACAEKLWRSSAEKGGGYMPLRNLALARYSHTGTREEAVPLLEEALSLQPRDEQLVFEKAWVLNRLGRFEETEAFLRSEAFQREDTAIEQCRALNRLGRYEEALECLLERRFTPCEGGEHAVAEQYMFAQHALGRALYGQGRFEEALSRFRAAQNLPDSLGAGLWNEVLLVPHRYYEALCLRSLDREEEARAIFLDILEIRQDYFTDMHLPEFPAWQAAVCHRMGQGAHAQILLAAHMRAQEKARRARGVGYAQTTPFFISYMENPQTQREAACDWQTAMIHWASGDGHSAASFAARALKGDPCCLYAGLLLQS